MEKQRGRKEPNLLGSQIQGYPEVQHCSPDRGQVIGMGLLLEVLPWAVRPSFFLRL